MRGVFFVMFMAILRVFRFFFFWGGGGEEVVGHFWGDSLTQQMLITQAGNGFDFLTGSSQRILFDEVGSYSSIEPPDLRGIWTSSPLVQSVTL